MPAWFISSGRFVYFLYDRFFSGGVTYRAAALTYTTLLALVPFMVVGLSIFAAFPVFDKMGPGIQDFIFENFVPATGKAVQGYLQTFVSQATQLSLLGFVFLIITAVMMLFTMEQAFNAIWQVRERRRGLWAFIIYWATLTLTPLFIGISLLASNYVLSVPLVAQYVALTGVNHLLLQIAPFTLTSIAFCLLYVALPNCVVPFWHAVIGAIVAGILFVLAKYGFGVYVIRANTIRTVYGALAIVPLFLIWLYVSWIIVLFGALVSHAITYRFSFTRKKHIDPFSHSLLWLYHLWCAQQKGKTLALPELIKLDRTGYCVGPEKQLNTLLDAKLIRRSRSGRYFLLRDMYTLSLESLRDMLPWKLPHHEDLKAITTPVEKYRDIINSLEQTSHEKLDHTLSELFQDFQNMAPAKKRTKNAS